MSRTIELVDKETVTVEVFSGLDGQGVPSYASGVDIEAHVRRTAALVLTSDGSEQRTPLTLYVPGDADTIPGEKDRVTVGSQTYIGLEYTPVRRLGASRAELDHVRLRCREE